MDKKIKALFFDIDGTLVSFKTHKIPQSTVDALEQAKKNGVEVYISHYMGLYFLLLDNLMPQNYKNITRNTTKRTKKAPKQANSYFLKVRLSVCFRAKLK